MVLITEYDVLCGKDKTHESHVGNRIYRDMIVAAAPLYAAATSKQDKMQMTSDIVSSLIMEHGSRFLKLSSAHGGWEEINIAAARDKTSHALRFCAAHMSPPPMKRRTKSKKERKATVSTKRIRRKISFDEGFKKKQCVSPEPTSSTLEPITYTSYNNHHDIYDAMSTWCVPPDVTNSIHDLSYDNTVVSYQPPPKQEQNGNNAFVPFASIPQNADIDTLWNCQLQEDDEYALVFET